MSAPELLGARRLRELLDRYGASPKRSLGQNFVIDPNTIRKVIDVAGITADDKVLEIGAGCGSLTLGLAASAKAV
ncbi:MAG: 16S rRNA (adenine(1518)-N(6)/adenine(1519)-N(6))-dimethyltransferase, partial [Actinobacteria bacterium]|nr:16S rRNA (adenine(1518)-N(6)/adenine(1519)-N(6))-dimethyltransferase [Actinomycetota bacterium]